MNLPDWQTSALGSKIRVALWLTTEIGVGGVFRKSDLRSAFPGVEQVDRRMRDLRQEGWQIETYREDRSLESDELRLVSIGGAVWESTYRSLKPKALSDSERRRVLANAGFLCVHCGISAGEAYPDAAWRTARLSARLAGSALR